MATLVVSAADERYARLLVDLFQSVRAAAVPDLHIGCLDLGLSEDMRKRIHPLAQAFAKPAWPFRPHRIFDTQPRYLSRAVRPFLPKYFPGYDTYVWLDADCWVQDRAALLNLAKVAANGVMAAVPAADRSYAHSDDSRGWVDRRNRMALGNEAADKLRSSNYINAGVLALRGDAPHWSAWATRFQSALDQWEGDFLSDQAIVNAMIYLDGLPSVFFPAEYNWVCHLRRPLWLAEKKRFGNPSFPWSEIGIIHNTFDDKSQVVPVQSTDGRTIATRMTYSAYRELAGI